MVDYFEQVDERTELGRFEVPEVAGKPKIGMENIWGREDPETGEELDSPFLLEAKGSAGKTVEKLHEQRSEKERIADESFDAEMTRDAEQWANNPDEYDYPGVDTVSPRIRRQRAERALEEAQDRGFVEGVDVSEDATRNPAVGGNFNKDEKQLNVRDSNTRGEIGQTMAHEVGHSVDFGVESERYALSVGVAESELADDLKDSSKFVRGPYQNESGYRGRSKEKFADFAALRITSPQRAKKNFPELDERVSEVTDFFEDL